MVHRIRQEEQEEFNAFHRQARRDTPSENDGYYDISDGLDNPFLHVGDIIQYHRLGFVCGTYPVMTASVLKISICSVGGKKFTVDLCNSDMVPQEHPVQKIYSYVDKKFVKLDNPRFLDLCEYNVGSVGSLEPSETPTTYAKLLHNDVSSVFKKLEDKFPGSRLITNLFAHNKGVSRTRRLCFKENMNCINNSIEFENYLDLEPFDERVRLVHGGFELFLDHVQPNTYNSIVEFVQNLHNSLIAKKIQFQEYISQHFENVNIYPTVKPSHIWYFMKCLCHNYIFLSNFYNLDQGINKTVRCPMKQLGEYKWSIYFNLEMIIKSCCKVRIDKEWVDYNKHVDTRVSKDDIWHQLVSIFIAFSRKILQGE